MSYILKAQASFSSGEPLEVTCRANMNSLSREDENNLLVYFYQIFAWKSPNILVFLFVWRLFVPVLKSIVPLLLVSKVLNTFSLKAVGFPPGNILLYIETNWGLDSSPPGQSLVKPWCQAWHGVLIISLTASLCLTCISSLLILVLLTRNVKSSSLRERELLLDVPPMLSRDDNKLQWAVTRLSTAELSLTSDRAAAFFTD